MPPQETRRRHDSKVKPPNPRSPRVIFWRFVFWRCLIAQVFQFLLMYPKRTWNNEHYIYPFEVRTLNLGWLWLKLGLTLAESSFGFSLMYPKRTVYIEHYISPFAVRTWSSFSTRSSLNLGWLWLKFNATLATYCEKRRLYIPFHSPYLEAGLEVKFTRKTRGS